MNQNRPDDGISRQRTVPVKEVKRGISRENTSSRRSYSGEKPRSASGRSYTSGTYRHEYRSNAGRNSSAARNYRNETTRTSYGGSSVSPGRSSGRKSSGSALKHYAKRSRRKRRIAWQRFVPVIICLAVMLYGAINLINYGLESLETRRTNKRLQEMYEAAEAAEAAATPAPTAAPEITPVPTPTPEPIIMNAEDLPSVAPVSTLLPVYQHTSGEMQASAKELYDQNRDFVGWLRIPGVVSLPVVYRDNSFYLNHDFNGRESKSGTLFLDANNPFQPATQHLVIHGHNMHDGTMFGLLAHYRNKGYIEAHPEISWRTLYRNETYEVFAVLVVPGDVSDPDFLAYTGTPVFRTVSQFESFINTLKIRAKHWKDIDIQPTDALMTLSTCLDDDRLIVVGRRKT